MENRKPLTIMYPKIHPTVLCITSSTSEKPLINQNCCASIVIEILQPIRSAFHHVTCLKANPKRLPMGMNTMTFMIFSTNKSGLS